MHITALSLDLPGNTPVPAAGEGLPSEAAPHAFQMALLKASQLALGTPEEPDLHLKAVAMGSVELITAQAPAPEASELKAFAAAQGLSPEALALLFDAPDAQVAPAGDTVHETAPLVTLTDSPPTDPKLETNPHILAVLPLGLAQWAPLNAAPTPASPTPAPVDPNVLPAGWQSTQVLLSAGGKPQAAGHNPPPDDPPMPEEVMNLLELDPEAVDLLQRLGLIEPEAPKTPIAATAKTLTLPTAGNESRTPIETLQRPTLLPGQAAAAPTPALAENATPADRAAQIQALAEKIGQALGQRIMGTIERGQWQVRLLLRPASLGEVEVDLRLRAGELDATLRAMNPLTRELLTEGLPRLREGLTQAGMDVAQLNVGTGDASRNGGNPTPRSFARKPEQSASGTAEGSPATQAVESSAIRRSGANGWDVLV